MSDAKEVEFSLKVLISKEKTRVLFAEASSDFVDVLLNFLTLPFGKIVKILEKHYGDKAPLIGSLTTLYKGLKNPTMGNFWTELGKQVLINPRSRSNCCSLKVSVDYTLPTEYQLGKPYAGVYTANTASFIICDDLRVVPNVTGSIIQTLSNLGFTITEMEGAEIRSVTFGFKEIMDLLKGSFISRTPLADIILDRRQLDFATVKSEPEILLHQIEIEATSNSKKMILKAMLQKSTKKLLFAQAEDDFIDFLFSILIIPLGRVEWLLGSNTCLSNIDNLYRSVTGLNDEKYLRTRDMESFLVKPELADVYTSTPAGFFRGPPKHFLPLSEGKDHCSQSIKNKNFVRGPRMYMITDDLTVTPLGVTSGLSFLNGIKISLSDVEELELHIGLEEALSILKASLTSTAALTHGLIDPLLKKQQKPKQEH